MVKNGILGQTGGFNLQSLQDSENIPIPFFASKYRKITTQA